MGCAIPFSDDLPFEQKVKCMGDDELLEIWAESQQLEQMINSELPHGCIISPDYEKAIINELTIRASKKYTGKRPTV